MNQEPEQSKDHVETIWPRSIFDGRYVALLILGILFTIGWIAACAAYGAVLFVEDMLSGVRSGRSGGVGLMKSSNSSFSLALPAPGSRREQHSTVAVIASVCSGCLLGCSPHRYSSCGSANFSINPDRATKASDYRKPAREGRTKMKSRRKPGGRQVVP